MLVCKGGCNSTVHRYCAGVTCKHYAKLTMDAEPFTCQYCMLRAYRAMVVQLQSDVENLKSEIASTKAALQARTPEGRAEDKLSEGAPLSYAEAMSGGGKKLPQPTTTSRTQPQPRFVSDNKFSIVLYGVSECPPGSPRLTRLESDITSVVSVFSTLTVPYKPIPSRNATVLESLTLNVITPNPDQFLCTLSECPTSLVF